jgi:hypothetical protein
VTVAALALPAAMAYAEVAGLSPVSGLYALLLPTVAFVLPWALREVQRSISSGYRSQVGPAENRLRQAKNRCRVLRPVAGSSAW